MKFIIVGFGRVGMRSARLLNNEGHDIVVIDTDRRRVERAEEEGFRAIEGDGGQEAVLERAGVSDADAVGALTGDLNTNFSACVIGDTHGCRTVLRVNEDFSEQLYERYTDSVDEVIYPERLGAAGAKTALLGGDFNVIADLTEQLSVASVEVPEGSPVIGDRVIDIELPGDTQIYAHGREDESMTIPLPQTRVESGDSIAVMTDPDLLEEVKLRLRGEEVSA